MSRLQRPRLAPARQRGLTLIELMIASTLGLLLLAGVATLFFYTNRSNRQNDLFAGMQDQARFAMATLSRDLAMAGYWGGLASAGSISTTSTGNSALTPALDCGVNATTAWAMQFTQRLDQVVSGVTTTTAWTNRIEFQNNATSPSSTWRCVGGQRSGTDVLAIRRMAGQQTGTLTASATNVTLRPYNFYLQTNGVVGSIARWGATAAGTPNSTDTPASAPMTFYRFLPRIYYVRDYARTSGDNTPSLCRKELCPSGYSGSGESASCGSGSAASLGFYTECLAEGVEDLQVVWGIDADNDGIADRYTSTPSAVEVSTQAKTAQIFLRMRSTEADGSYVDQKTYKNIGDAADYTPSTATEASGTPELQKAKHFYRRVYSTTVQLRNPVR